ncbi:uncharacterized protein G2W53_026582 [Senna tora]|uniref:Uncharacterized protein n=1 Tax=Senna tora TaxID=362788 RepID=A0A834TFC4_9FABA|nr:uncharacterized protein G2W53_026582 [Senna tora]
MGKPLSQPIIAKNPSSCTGRSPLWFEPPKLINPSACTRSHCLKSCLVSQRPH